MRSFWVYFGDISVFVLTAAALFFTLYYQLKANWKATSAGRDVMAFSRAFALVGIYICYAAIVRSDSAFNSLSWEAIIARDVIYSYFAYRFIRRSVILVQSVRRDDSVDVHGGAAQ